MKKNVFTTLMLLTTTISSFCKVVPSSLIGDNMVLQQQTKVTLWGKATPEAMLTVSPSWSDESYRCKVSKEGNWFIKVPTPQAGYTTHSIHFDDGEKISIHNILIGEVWIASGQSNMEMPLKGFENCPVKGSIEAIADAVNHPQIRMFNVPRKLSHQPEKEVEGNWEITSCETASQFSAVAYFFALSLNRTLNVPVGIINCSVGGSKVESWMPERILRTYSDVNLNSEQMEKTPDYLRPMVFYNAMLHPTIPYTIKGFIWYQGESNVGEQGYAERMADMVRHWREERRQGELPFYYVELAPYRYKGHQSGKGALLREEQCKAQSLIPNSGMICTNDLVNEYEADNVHPCNKETIGKRLSYMALNKTYGKKHIACHSPEFRAMEISGSRIKLSFRYVMMGYTRNSDIRGFEVAGEDKVFYPADKVERERNDWWISSEKVPHPVAVRYCFKDYQVGNLGGNGELPMIPFRTDNW